MGMIVLNPHSPQCLESVPFPYSGPTILGFCLSQEPTTIGSHRVCPFSPLLLVFGQANVAQAFLLAFCSLRVQAREQPRWRTLCQHIERVAHCLSDAFQPTACADGSRSLCVGSVRCLLRAVIHPCSRRGSRSRSKRRRAGTRLRHSERKEQSHLVSFQLYAEDILSISTGAHASAACRPVSSSAPGRRVTRARCGGASAGWPRRGNRSRRSSSSYSIPLLSHLHPHVALRQDCPCEVVSAADAWTAFPSWFS